MTGFNKNDNLGFNFRQATIGKVYTQILPQIFNRNLHIFEKCWLKCEITKNTKLPKNLLTAILTTDTK